MRMSDTKACGESEASGAAKGHSTTAATPSRASSVRLTSRVESLNTGLSGWK